MISPWPNYEEVGSSYVFDALHFGLTVELVSTPRKILMTCVSSETVADVMARRNLRVD